MTKKILLLSITMILVASVWRASAGDEPPASGEVGRYQMVAGLDGRVYVLDTAFGQCWSRAGGEWRDEGNPTKAPKDGRAPVPGPVQLMLPSRSVEMTVMQREERSIPGSSGTVRLKLGDVTDGQAMFSVITSEGKILLERKSVEQGDRVEFSLGKMRFVATIEELRNILIGIDFARIRVSVAEKKKPNRKPQER